MKSYNSNQSQGPSRFQRMWMGVLCLRPRAVLGAMCVLVGLVLIVGATAAQSLVNFPARPAEQPRQSDPPTATPQMLENQSVGTAQRYQPTRPPMASDPGLLQAPDLVARGLNESDAAYTARMMRLSQQLKSEDAAAQQELANALKKVSAAGYGMGVEVVAVPQLPAASRPVPPVAGIPSTPYGELSGPRQGWERKSEQER